MEIYRKCNSPFKKHEQSLLQKNFNVLIVDDNIYNIMAIKLLLE